METIARPETRAETFERGRVDGEVHARLLSHDLQFLELKSSISQLVTLTVSLDKGTQSLADGARSSAATAIALATALKEEKDTARETLVAEKQKSENSWTPFGRGMTVLTALVGLAGTAYLITH